MPCHAVGSGSANGASPGSAGDKSTEGKIGGSTLHWDCKAVQANGGAVITEGRAIRIYAQIQEDGNLKAIPIPEEIAKALSEPRGLISLPEDDA